MDAKAADTTRALNRLVLPLLQSFGFNEWVGRRGWRRRRQSELQGPATGSDIEVSVIELRGFSAAEARTFECTTASLSAWAGVQPPWLPYHSQPKPGPNGPKPEESEAFVRMAIAPSARFGGHPLGIWVINTKADTERAASDLASQLEACGLAWLEQSWSAVRVADHIQGGHHETVEQRPDGSRLLLDYRIASTPMARRALAYALEAMGRRAEAAVAFEAARWFQNEGTPTPRLLDDDHWQQEMLAGIGRTHDRS